MTMLDKVCFDNPGGITYVNPASHLPTFTLLETTSLYVPFESKLLTSLLLEWDIKKLGLNEG